MPTVPDIIKSAGLTDHPDQHYTYANLQQLVAYMQGGQPQVLANQLRCWVHQLRQVAPVPSPAELAGIASGLEDVANDLAEVEPDFCPASEDNVHVLDLNSLSINRDGGDAYVDVNCGACGRSGCLHKVNVDEPVDW